MQHANLIVVLPGHCRALPRRGGLDIAASDQHSRSVRPFGAKLLTVVVKFRLELSRIRFVQHPKVFLRFEPSLNNGCVTAVNPHISNEIPRLCNSLLAINLLDFRQQPESGSESIFFFNEQSSQGDSLPRIGFIVQLRTKTHYIMTRNHACLVPARKLRDLHTSLESTLVP